MRRRPFIWGDSHALVGSHVWNSHPSINTILHVDAHADLGHVQAIMTDGNFLSHLVRSRPLTIYWIVPRVVTDKIDLSASSISSLAPCVSERSGPEQGTAIHAVLPNGGELVVCPLEFHRDLNLSGDVWVDIDLDFISFGKENSVERAYLKDQVSEWLENASVLSLALSLSCGTTRLTDIDFAKELFAKVENEASYRFVSKDGIKEILYKECFQILGSLADALKDDEGRLVREMFFHGSSSKFIERTASLRNGCINSNNSDLIFRRISALIRMGHMAEAADELKFISRRVDARLISEMQRALADAIALLEEV